MDYNNIRSANAAGQAAVERWKIRWAREFFKPLAEDQMRMTIASMPADVLQQLYEKQPEAMTNLLSKLGGKDAGQSRQTE